MTSPYFTPYVNQPPAPRSHPPQRSHPGLRMLLAVTVVVAGIVGAGISALIGAIVWSGCFIECSNPDHIGGAALFLLAATSLASGPAAVSGLYRSAGWMGAAVVTFAFGLTAAAIGVSAA